MPVRIVCPSCATQLNIRDEHAGRPVKCPKCQYIIPPSQAAPPVIPAGAAPPDADVHPATPVAAPLPAPPKSAGGAAPPLPTVEPFDDPAPRPKPPAGGATPKPQSPPAAKGGLEPPRPAARSPRDRDRDRDRDRKWDDADDGDRPRRRPRRRDEDADADRPKKKGSKVGLLLAIFGGLLLVCCGGGGVGVWYLAKKGKEFAETHNPNATYDGYKQIKLNMTRAQVEAVLGPGKPVTADDLPQYFTNAAAGFKPADWQPLAEKGRAFVWRNRDDFLLAGFYPDADGKLQVKAWHPKLGATASDGTVRDDRYLAEYSMIDPGTGGTGGTGGADLSGPAVEVKAVDLAKAYKADKAAADAKYKDKVLVVEGKMTELVVVLDRVVPHLEGLTAPPGQLAGEAQVRCPLRKDAIPAAWNLSRGQTVKVRGKGAGSQTFAGILFVDLLDCKIEGQGPDPSAQVQAAGFIDEFAADGKKTDEKYKDKPITLTNAVVESKQEAALILVGTPGKKAAGQKLKIKATWPFDSRSQLKDLKPGDRVKVKGEYSSVGDGTIYLNRCWLVP